MFVICTDINLGNIYGTSEDAVHDVLDQGIKILTNEYNDWKSISRGDTGAKRAKVIFCVLRRCQSRRSKITICKSIVIKIAYSNTING